MPLFEKSVNRLKSTRKSRNADTKKRKGVIKANAGNRRGRRAGRKHRLLNQSLKSQQLNKDHKQSLRGAFYAFKIILQVYFDYQNSL